MNDRKIKRITVLGRGYKIVGECGVTKIIDVTIEYPDSIFPAYEVYEGDKVISRVENCPVVIEYE